MTLEDVLQFPNTRLDKLGPFKSIDGSVHANVTFEASVITEATIGVFKCGYLFAKNSTAKEGFKDVDLTATIDHVSVDIPHPFDPAMPGTRLLPEKVDNFKLFRTEGGGVGLSFRAVLHDQVDALHNLVDFLKTYGVQEFMLKFQPMQPETLGKNGHTGGEDAFDPPNPQPKQQMLTDGRPDANAPELNEDNVLQVTEDPWEDDGFYPFESNEVKAVIRILKGLSGYRYQFRIIDGDSKATAVDDRDYKTHSEALGMAAMHLDREITTAWRRNNANLTPAQKAAGRAIAAWAKDVGQDPDAEMEKAQAKKGKKG